MYLSPVIIQSQENVVYVGTKSNQGNQGIYLLNFERSTGKLTLRNQFIDAKNPSFLAISPDKKTLYAAEENNPGSISALSIDKNTGELTYINAVSSEGAGPCFVTTDRTGKWCFAGNYMSGNMAVLPILSGGGLGKASQIIQHDSAFPGLNKDGKPHIHSINIAANNRDVFVVDLGTDRIMCYKFNHKTGKLVPSKTPHLNAEQGAGPRHFAFHPKSDYAYCIMETNNTITAYKYQDGSLIPFQTINTLPSNFNEISYCADIHISPDGRYLYGSNRGHNSISIFTISQKTGALSLIGHQSTFGIYPRNFAIDPSGEYLLVANQKSDNIQVFNIDNKTGLLTSNYQEIKLFGPVCLKFL